MFMILPVAEKDEYDVKCDLGYQFGLLPTISHIFQYEALNLQISEEKSSYCLSWNELKSAWTLF